MHLARASFTVRGNSNNPLGLCTGQPDLVTRAADPAWSTAADRRTLRAMGRSVAAEPAAHPVVARLAREVIPELGDLTEQLVGQLRHSDRDYLTVPVRDLRDTVRWNFGSFLGDLAEQRSPSTASSRETGRRRAGQGVPLASVLRAYRLGSQVIWQALADRALQAGPAELEGLVRESGAVWTWVDTSSEAVNAEYHEALIESARRDEQQRLLLLDALFEGRLGEWKLLGGSLHAIGLPERGPYLAVSAETREAGSENLPGVSQVLRRRGIACAWRLRAGEQVGVIALSREHSFRLVRDLLASLASGRVGLSPGYDDAMDTARSLVVAAVARRCLPAGSGGVATIDDNPAAALIAGAPDVSARVVRQLLRGLAGLPPGEREMLLTTLRTWLKTSGNASAAAELLHCHRNTIRNRLRRLEELTGYSLGNPREVSLLSIAAEGAGLLWPDSSARVLSSSSSAVPT